MEAVMSLLRMTKTLFKNVIHGPYTTLYPVKPKENFERTRGKVAIDVDDCILCGLCMRRCPTGAIKVDKPKNTWSKDRFKCIQCNYCGEVCPKKCLKMDNQYTSPASGEVKDEYTKCMNTQSPSESSK
jgi:formate hydrogenlyase subunit 6/NADH:ubiquinone oxidoreductase subunit I